MNPTQLTELIGWKPTHDYLIVIPELAPEEHAMEGPQGSVVKLYIPEQARKGLTEGHILLKGPDCSDRLHGGDDVVFLQSSEFKFKEGETPFIVVQECNIILCKPAKLRVQMQPTGARCAMHDKPQPCPICREQYDRDMKSQTHGVEGQPHLGSRF